MTLQTNRIGDLKAYFFLEANGGYTTSPDCALTVAVKNTIDYNKSSIRSCSK